jgi:hypothetical protein
MLDGQWLALDAWRSPVGSRKPACIGGLPGQSVAGGIAKLHSAQEQRSLPAEDDINARQDEVQLGV